MKRLAVLLLELVLVTAAVFLADATRDTVPYIPTWLIKLPPVYYSDAEFWRILGYFVAIHAVVFALLGWRLGPWRPADAKRTIEEVFALAVGFALSALTIFITTTIGFNPHMMVGIAVCGSLMCLLAHLLTASRAASWNHRAAALGRALFGRMVSVPGVLALVFALSPGILAVAYSKDRDIANVITQIRIYLAGRVETDWTFDDAMPGRTFHQPIALRFAPGREDELWLLERGGRIFRMPYRIAGEPELVIDARDRVGYVEVENGALGFDHHPTFGSEGPSSDHLYLYYTSVIDGAQVNRLSRFDVSLGSVAARTGSEHEILVWDRPDDGFHNGGQLEFGPDGFLYLGIGEMSQRGVQTLTTALAAGLVRIDVDKRGGAISHPVRFSTPDLVGTQDYFIPNDNPFCSAAGDRLEEYWAIGLRNTFRFCFDPDGGAIWGGDVGSTVWEEVNLIKRGHNYGFPFIEGRKRTKVPGPDEPIGTLEGPIYTYRHTSFDRSVIGGLVYRGEEYPALNGRYIFGDNYSGKIFTLPAVDAKVDKVEILAQAPEYAQRGFTSFTVAPDGAILLTFMGKLSAETGRVLRLLPGDESDGTGATAATGAPEIVSAADIANIYNTNCTRCHGAQGRGDGPDSPHLEIKIQSFAAGGFLATRDDAYLRKIIEQGGQAVGKSPLMMQWGHILSDAELAAMVDHVIELAGGR